MAFNLLLVPIHLVDKFWGIARPGLEQSIKRSEGLHNHVDILDNLKKNWWQLWMAYDDGMYLGFLITEIHDDPKGGYVSIPYGFSDIESTKGLDYDAFRAAVQIVEDFAKALGAHTLILTSGRKGYHKRVGEWGFRPFVMSFRKDLRG